jgi:2-polyprenyl-3-methyl-5-hydroxy-6-metoxy-1,4-benzoquinol methylase
MGEETARKGEAFNPSYVGPRTDVEKLLPQSVTRVLDFGCSNGALGAELKARRPGIRVCGVEMNRAMAEEARGKLDEVVEGDLERTDLGLHFSAASFDALIFADILEHLVDPWTVLRRSTELLGPRGYALICLPNIRHVSTLTSLIFRDRWPYRDRGIHDRTHLRWFTLKNAKELVSSAGLELLRVKRNYRIIERPHRANAISPVFALPILRGFLTFQYLLLSRKP